MRRLIHLLLGLSFLSATTYSTGSKAAELTDPIEILKKVDAATKAVTAVKYVARLKGAGAAESRISTVEGTVLLSGWANNAPQEYRCDVKVMAPHSSKVRSITIAGDDTAFFVIDHKAKKAYTGIDPAVILETLPPAQQARLLRNRWANARDGVSRAAAPAAALWVREFLHPTPFSDEIKSRKQVLKSSKWIGGEECYEIHIFYANDIGEAVWWFSKRDFLPRGVQRVLKTPSGERAIQQWELTDVVVDPTFTTDLFQLDLPAGYTRTDVFAP